MFWQYIRHRQCDGYEKRARYKIMYSICYIALENNTLHKFKVNKINRCMRMHTSIECQIDVFYLLIKVRLFPLNVRIDSLSFKPDTLYRVWATCCTNPALQLKFFLKKTDKGTICPLQNLGKKTRKEEHMKRFISVQKLQAKTEHGKYILSHV